jgi:hypothetical protein
VPLLSASLACDILSDARLRTVPANQRISPDWPIRRFFMKLVILVIIVFGVSTKILTGLTYGSGSPSVSPTVSPKARLTIATSQDPMLLQLLDSPFYLKLRCQLELTYILPFTCGCLAGGFR